MFGSNNDKWNLRSLIQEIKKFREQLIYNMTFIFQEGNATTAYLTNCINKSASTGVRINSYEFKIIKDFYRIISMRPYLALQRTAPLVMYFYL